MSVLNTPIRVPLRNVENVTPTNMIRVSTNGTPATSPGPALLQAIYLSNSKNISSPRTVQNKCEGKTLKECGPIKISPEDNNVPYFRNLISSETTRLTNMCNKWESDIPDITAIIETTEQTDELGNILSFTTNFYEPKFSELNENYKQNTNHGDIRTVVGQGRLIMEQRFNQFEGLVDNCEFNSGEKTITCEDLQGFWDMIYFQVEDVNNKFDKLQKKRENGWKPETIAPLPCPIKKRKIIKKSATQPSAAVIAKRKELARQRAESRKRLQAAKAALMKNSQTPQKGATVTFDAGFFKIESPAKLPDEKVSSPLNSDVKWVPNKETLLRAKENSQPITNVQSGIKKSPDVPRKLNFLSTSSNDYAFTPSKTSTNNHDITELQTIPISPTEAAQGDKSRKTGDVADKCCTSTEAQTKIICMKESACQTNYEIKQPLEVVVTELLMPEGDSLPDSIDPIAYKKHYYRLFAKVKAQELLLSQYHNSLDEVKKTGEKMKQTSRKLLEWQENLTRVKVEIEEFEVNKNKLNETSQKLLEMQKQLDVKNKKYDELLNMHENLLLENEEVKKNIFAVQNKNDELKKSLDEYKQETTTHCEEIKRLNDLVLCLKDNVATKDLEIDGAYQKMQHLVEKTGYAHERMESNIQTQNENISTLQAENNLLNEQLAALRDQNQNMDEKIETLSYVEDECKSWKEQLENTEKMLQNETLKTLEMKNLVSEANTFIDDLKQKINEKESIIEEQNADIDGLKGQSYLMVRVREQEISYAQSGLLHIHKMMKGLNDMLYGLIDTPSETKISDLEKDQSEDMDSQSTDDTSKTLSELVEKVEKTMQSIINTCATVQMQYKKQIMLLKSEQRALELKLSDRDSQLNKREDSKDELIRMLEKQVHDVRLERDQKIDDLDRYMEHDTKRNSEMLELLQYKEKYKSLKFSNEFNIQKSFFTPRKTQRRKSSSVGNLNDIEW